MSDLQTRYENALRRAVLQEAENARLQQRVAELEVALSWAMDIMDMYDERLAGIDGPTVVYTNVHVAGKRKARAALESAGE